MSALEDAGMVLSDMDIDRLLSDAFMLPEGAGVGALMFPGATQAAAAQRAAQFGALPDGRAPPVAGSSTSKTPSPLNFLGGLLLARDRHASPFSGVPAAAIGSAQPPAPAFGAGQAPPVLPSLIFGQQPQPQLQQLQQQVEGPTTPQAAQAPQPPLLLQQQQPQQQQQQQQWPPVGAPAQPQIWPPQPQPQPQLQQQEPAAPASSGDTAAEAPAEAAPAKRGRGRPTKVAGQYTASYAAVREYRVRSKNRLPMLTQQLEQKMEQLQLLTAENQALVAREIVLQVAIRENEAALELAKARATAEASEPEPAAGAAAGAGAGEAGQDGGEEGEGETGPGAGAAPVASPPPNSEGGEPSAAMLELMGVYKEYIKRLRSRTVDGKLQPLQPWEERYPPPKTLMRLHMKMPPEEGVIIMTTNLETGERVRDVPQDWWRRVAQGIELSPEQEARVSAAMDAFFGAMRRLSEKRHELRGRLEGALGRLHAHAAAPGGGAGAAGDSAAAGVDHQEILDELRANLIREERVWKTTTWALTMMVEEVQIGTASLLSWPYPVRFVQVFAAKLDREDELRV